MRNDFIAGRFCGSRHRKEGLNRPSFGLGGADAPPPLSGIDSIHNEPRMKSIAVEAFGRHLEGADASAPFFLLEVFSDFPEKPRGGIWFITFPYPLNGSVGYRAGGAWLSVKVYLLKTYTLGWRREKEIARRAPGYQFECTCVARVPKV